MFVKFNLLLSFKKKFDKFISVGSEFCVVLPFPKVKKMYFSFLLVEQISTPVNITCKKQDVIYLHIFTLIGGIIMITTHKLDLFV